MIPHIIEIETDNITLTKSDIRKKYNISQEKFVVLINCGNYDFQNRKSLDTSIFAFEEFNKKYPNSLLYIHAFNVKKINNKNDLVPIDKILNIEDLISYTNISNESIIVNENILEYNEILELFKMSDVLLQCSKSEGFGIPILEAQLMGIPSYK